MIWKDEIMKQNNCEICRKPHSSTNSAIECESSCIAIEQQYMDYYGTPNEFSKTIVKQPTTVVIEMPNNVTVKITCVN